MSSPVEIALDDSNVIVCRASVTSCCKFSGKVFISLGYLSKLLPRKRYIIHNLLLLNTSNN